MLVALLLLAPAPANAITLVLPDGTERPQPWQRWLDASVIPTPPWRVTLHVEPCPYYDPPAAACAGPWGTEKVIYMDHAARQVFHHEVGHLADAAFLDDGERAHFMRLARAAADASAWWKPLGFYKPSPGEMFADTWAACTVTGRLRWHWGAENSLSEWPRTLRPYRWLCPFIVRASRDPGSPLPPPVDYGT